MKKNIRKRIYRTSILLAVLLFGYGVYYFLFNGWIGECGFNDGPFEGKIIQLDFLSDSARTFPLDGEEYLYIDNRSDSLAPIIALIKDEDISWIIDTDLINTPKCKSCSIWEINNVTITYDNKSIKLHFVSYWTYGREWGSMQIKRKNGKNSFCLSW